MKQNHQRMLAMSLIAMMLMAAAAQLALTGAQALEPYFSGAAMHQSYREEAPLAWMMVNASDVAFRAGPGLNHDLLFAASYGTAVEVIGERNGWYNVLHWTCPEPAWVWGEYLQDVTSAGP